MEALELASCSPEGTRDLGAQLGQLVQPGDVLLLIGGLGAGKTVFAQGVAAGLGVREPVTSPTFAIIHEYAGRLPLYHVDLFRLSGDTEAADVGLEEYLAGGGVVLIEWPERAPQAMPADHLSITLAAAGTEGHRTIQLQAHGRRSHDLLVAGRAHLTQGKSA